MHSFRKPLPRGLRGDLSDGDNVFPLRDPLPPAPRNHPAPGSAARAALGRENGKFPSLLQQGRAMAT